MKLTTSKPASKHLSMDSHNLMNSLGCGQERVRWAAAGPAACSRRYNTTMMLIQLATPRRHHHSMALPNPRVHEKVKHPWPAQRTANEMSSMSSLRCFAARKYLHRQLTPTATTQLKSGHFSMGNWFEAPATASGCWWKANSFPETVKTDGVRIWITDGYSFFFPISSVEIWKRTLHTDGKSPERMYETRVLQIACFVGVMVTTGVRRDEPITWSF